MWISPNRGALALSNLKYATHARTDVPRNHTMVSGHELDDDLPPNKHRLVDAYTAGKETACPYMTHRLTTPTVSDPLPLKYAPGYGRSSTKDGKTLKLKGNAAHFETTAECHGPDVPCHHSTRVAFHGNDGTPMLEDPANCANHDPVNDSGNPSNWMAVTTNKHCGGNAFESALGAIVPDKSSEDVPEEVSKGHELESE